MSTTCSTASAEAAEATIGSAPHAAAWVCLEQPGAWGPKAFTGSHLDPEVGKRFEDAATAAGVRPQLIRRPGRHPESPDAPRHVLIAFTMPGATWLLEGRIQRPERLLDLDFSAVAAGQMPDWPELSIVSHPVLLVCTHARRDVCCATLGRDVANHAARAFPGRVWEASHLSGHRFAATTTLLPSGHMHGRVVDARALLAGADHGDLVGTGWRGRSTWPGPGQVAESAVREKDGIWSLDGLTVALGGNAWEVDTPVHRRTVTVTEYTDDMAPPSCGKRPEPVRRFTSVVQ